MVRNSIIGLGIIIGIGVTAWFFAGPSSMNTHTQNLPSSSGGGVSKGNPIAVFETNKGNISIELFVDKAPITAGNFLKLAREGFYNNTKFHRVISNFMIQGGDPLSKDDSKMGVWGTGGPGYTIQDEFAPGFSNVRGTISMANAGPNTGGSQFFINQVDNTYLDGKHAVFGRVVSGLEVVDAIASTSVGDRDIPVSPIVIVAIRVDD